jgi:hypothetical protein
MAQGTTKGVPIDTDNTLAADSDILVPSQKAVKAYISNLTYDATKIANGNVSNTEFQYLDGVTSAIQTQIDGKQATLTNPVTGTGTNNEIATFNSTGSTITSLSTSTYPSLTEFSYGKGVTSAIQTQLDNRSVGIATSGSVSITIGSTGTANLQSLTGHTFTIVETLMPVGATIQINGLAERLSGTGTGGISYPGKALASFSPAILPPTVPTLPKTKPAPAPRPAAANCCAGPCPRLAASDAAPYAESAAGTPYASNCGHIITNPFTSYFTGNKLQPNIEPIPPPSCPPRPAPATVPIPGINDPAIPPATVPIAEPNPDLPPLSPPTEKGCIVGGV